MKLPAIIVFTNSDATTREMSDERFMQILSARLKNVVQGEGSITAKVVSSNEWVDDDGETRIIVSFNALAIDQVETIKEHLQNGEYQEALNLSLTSNFRPDSRYIPSLGEVCKLSIGTVEDRAGNQVLRIVGVAPLPKAEKKSFSLDDLLADTAAPNPEPATALTAEKVNAMNKEELQALATANGIDLSQFHTGNGSIKQSFLPKVKETLITELV